MNHYTLSDSDMLGITEAINSGVDGSDTVFFGIKATWNAILAQEGKSWDDYTPDNPLPTTQFAIPRDQSAEILEKIKSHVLALGVSPIGVTNLMMDFINYGPSFYEDSEVSDRNAAIMDTFDSSWADD